MAVAIHPAKPWTKTRLQENETEVMWVKGSGGDIGTLKKSGLAALYVDVCGALKNIYRGLEFEDEMVELFNHCIYDLKSKAPSIDTPLHGFLPFKHIDHLHPDAAIAIAAAKDGKKITQELFNGTIGWVEWQRPGFDLGLQLKQCLDENPGIRGIMLGSHGLFTWGDTAYECISIHWKLSKDVLNYLEAKVSKESQYLVAAKLNHCRKKNAANRQLHWRPCLRGFCSSETKMIGHFTDDEAVLEFINSNDLDRLAPLGTSCPDHFLRTKISPLVLTLEPDAGSCRM